MEERYEETRSRAERGAAKPTAVFVMNKGLVPEDTEETASSSSRPQASRAVAFGPGMPGMAGPKT